MADIGWQGIPEDSEVSKKGMFKSVSSVWKDKEYKGKKRGILFFIRGLKSLNFRKL